MRGKQGHSSVDAAATEDSVWLTAEEQKGQLPERNLRRTTSLRHLTGLSLPVSLVQAGCSHAPEYTIFGSFFPVWIFCSVGGLLLMACTRALIARTAFADHIAAPVLSYLSMAILLTCALWLLFYR